MRALGRHIIAELSECSVETLSCLERVREIMVRAALEAKAEIREVAFHKFNPQGVSGVVVIAESHLSIHTWPEFRYAAIDIYTCGEKTDPWRACYFIAREFESQSYSTIELQRGIQTKGGRYFHTISSSDSIRENVLV